MKIAYTTEQGDDELCVHIVSLSRQYYEEGLAFLKEKCGGKLTPGGKYYSTGVGIGEYLETIENTLNIE